MVSSRWTIRTLLAGIAVSASIVCVLVLRSAPADSQTPATSTPTSEAYAIFQQAPSANDDFSKWRTSPSVVAARDPFLGLEPSGARLVYHDDLRAVAAVPASKAPCFIERYNDGGGGVSCGRGPGTTVSMTYDSAIGLVPDEVKTVTFAMTDGSRTEGQVHNNLWISPAGAADVTFSVGGAEQHMELLSKDSLPKGATISPNGVVGTQSAASTLGR
jgi:hypothetical protein